MCLELYRQFVGEDNIFKPSSSFMEVLTRALQSLSLVLLPGCRNYHRTSNREPPNNKEQSGETAHILCYSVACVPDGRLSDRQPSSAPLQSSSVIFEGLLLPGRLAIVLVSS